MPLYIISYDLNKEKDYTKLIKELKEHKCHKVQMSLWFGNFTNTASEVLKHFSDFVDDDDNLLVAKFNKSEIDRKRSLQGTTDWLNAN